MHSVDLEVLRASVAWLDQGSQVTLATVVQTWGSAPRPVGAMLAISGDGRLVGSVSGGCIEDDLLIRVKAQGTSQRLPEIVTYGVTADEARRFGLPCGGTLQLVLEPMRAGANLHELLSRIERREIVSRRLDLKTGKSELAAAERSEELQFDGETLITVHGPRWRLAIIGAGQMTVYLAQMAQALDYLVMVCDPREEYRVSWDIPGVTIDTRMPDDFVTAVQPDAHTAVVALTHDPKQDDLALMEALKSKAFYVGALGSRSNQEKRRERLAQFELTPAQLTRLRGPVGLPIGSRTPPEMAVAILADLTAVRNGIELQAVKPKAASAEPAKLSAVS